MKLREMRHELVALREGLKGFGERLGELSREMEGPREVVCGRCERVAENEEAFSDEVYCGRLEVGREEIHLTPMETVILEMLLANRGKVVVWDRLLFNTHESGGRRAWRRDEETLYPKTSLLVVLSRLRKKMKGLPIFVETERGVGLVLVNLVRGKVRVRLS